MNKIDYIIISMIIFFSLVSLFRGFVREFISLITWILSFFISSNYYHNLSILFQFIEEKIIRNSISIILLFIIVFIFGSIINDRMNSLIEKIKISGINHLFGLVFGGLKGIVITLITFFLLIFSSLMKILSMKLFIRLILLKK